MLSLFGTLVRNGFYVFAATWASGVPKRRLTGLRGGFPLPIDIDGKQLFVFRILILRLQETTTENALSKNGQMHLNGVDARS